MRRGREGQDNSFLDEILEDIDLEAWLDDMGLAYKRVGNGTNLNIQSCPFCGDERWRVYASAENKRGICFHADCDRKFNLYSFARELLGADNRGTVRHFEEYAARNLGKVRQRPVRAEPVTTGWSLPPNVALPTEDGATHPYLVDRRITLDTQAHFDLRWCESGLYAYKDVYGTAKEMWFGGRVLLPIYDIDGTLSTFVGRDATGAATVRYLFPPELPSASRFLYGGNHLPGVKHLVITEGPFDAIATHQAIKDHPDFRKMAATASFGLSIGHGDQAGNDQLGRLLQLRSKGLERVTLMWDGERNAFNHALDAVDMLKRKLSGVEIRLATLPHDTDPAEVETQVVRDAISKAKPVTPQNMLLWRLNSPYQ